MSSLHTQVFLRKVSPKEAEALQALCHETYVNYFADYWEGPGLKFYLEEQFSIKRLQSDLNNDDVDYYFVCSHEEVAGYLKISYKTAFAEFEPETACELEKIYISPEFIGQGIGRQALNAALKMTRNLGKKSMHLCVLDTNSRSISFYKRAGFEFQKKIRLKYAHFKEELKGLQVLKIEL